MKIWRSVQTDWALIRPAIVISHGPCATRIWRHSAVRQVTAASLVELDTPTNSNQDGVTLRSCQICLLKLFFEDVM